VIRFEDLMAARWLYSQFPEHRDVLLGGLEALREGRGQSLLGTLVSSEIVTMDQAHYVHSVVEDYKRGQAVAIYRHLLGRDGVPAARVRALVEQIGTDGDINGLGEVLMATNTISPEREKQLRFQARLALDRDMAMQVQQHMASRGGVMAAPRAEEPDDSQAEKRLFLSSTVIKGLDAMNLMANLHQSEEVARIVEGTLSDADGELPGPRFRIPDWVDMSHPRTGRQMAGYRILGLIGAGAMGEVYLCDRQDDPDKPVALKILRADSDPDAKGRFKREILANSFFSHEGALEVYDAGKDDRGSHYLAMEFFDGRDLEKVLDETRRLPVKDAALLARQVFETLGASHDAGLVHRDVKPANILVSWDGHTSKLMDYGIALIEDLSEFKDQVFKSMEGNVTGTPEYMSPEQAGGDVVRASSDLYSMGVVLYQLVSGNLPFESETSGGYMTCHMIEDPIPLIDADPSCKTLPEGFLQLVDSLLTKTPNERPKNAAEVIARLDALTPSLGARPTGRLFSFLGWRRG
jgi:hypothetical protein